MVKRPVLHATLRCPCNTLLVDYGAWAAAYHDEDHRTNHDQRVAELSEGLTSSSAHLYYITTPLFSYWKDIS